MIDLPPNMDKLEETCRSVQEPLLELLQTLESRKLRRNLQREAEPPVDTQPEDPAAGVGALGEVRREEEEALTINA